MLILQRKKNESLMIGENIKISILNIGTESVKIAIEAPKDIPVYRTELLEAADYNREATSSVNDAVTHTIQEFFQKKEKDEPR